MTNSNVRHLNRPKPRFFFGWVQLGMACLAMLATLPGRSVGIGLITERLIDDLDIGRTTFGAMNFGATVVGASFALLCGHLIDRFGLRLVATSVAFLLAFTTMLFSTVTSAIMLLILLTLMRGLGQSALSTASITIIGKWFVRRLTTAMAVFSVLIAVGFAVLFVVTKELVERDSVGWRTTWLWIGIIIVPLSILFAMLLRRPPHERDVLLSSSESPAPESSASRDQFDAASTLSIALRTPVFWALAIGSAFFNLVIAGVTLWNESILAQLGFAITTYQTAGAIFLLFGIAGSFTTGWLAKRLPLGKLMAVALLLLAMVLVTYPVLFNVLIVYAHAALFGATGGAITVLFFTSWAVMFGRAHVGQIQGAAQVMAVLASATGPLVFGGVFDWLGSYNVAFFALAPIAFALAAFAWRVHVPCLP